MAMDAGKPVKTAYVLSNEPSKRDKSHPGTNVIALTIARNLGRAGIRVIRLHPTPHSIDLSSRYVETVHCPDCVKSPDEALRQLLEIGQRSAEPIVLFPATDECAKFASTHEKALSERFLIPQPRRDVIEQIINKRRMYDVATSIGVDIPDTHFPTFIEDIERIAPTMHYPCVIKPIVSADWRGDSVRAAIGAQKALVIKGADELIANYTKLSAVSRDLMVQEIIGGRDERLVTLLTYLDKDSQPIAFCIRKKIRQYPLDFGYCSNTETISSPTIKDLSFRLLRHLRYTGLAGVEFKEDPADGKYKLIEINTRAVQTIGIAASSGVNLPLIAYRDMIGERVEPTEDYRVGVKWVYETLDLMAAKGLVTTGKLTYREWLRSVTGATSFALYARDDLRPFLRSMFHFARNALFGVKERGRKSPA
jgi:D-aspartate ligase